MKKYDASIPRRMHWDDDIHCSTKCPECNNFLEGELHTYLVLIKDGQNIEQFMMGNDAGKFCPNCPVVVLEKNEFCTSVVTTTGAEKFRVVGIIDMDSASKNENEEDLPLVEFLEPTIAVKLSHKKRKIGRNDPCPCGSGKKFKKCCISLSDNVSTEQSRAKPRYRFEAGTYGDEGKFLPSIACIKMVGKEEAYHFMLVKPDKTYEEEDQALTEATKDIDQAFTMFKTSDMSEQQLAAELKDRGYVKVDDFNIVKEAEHVH